MKTPPPEESPPSLPIIVKRENNLRCSKRKSIIFPIDGFSISRGISPIAMFDGVGMVTFRTKTLQ